MVLLSSFIHPLPPHGWRQFSNKTQLSYPPKILGNSCWELHPSKPWDFFGGVYLFEFWDRFPLCFPQLPGQGKFCQSLSSQVKWPSQPWGMGRGTRGMGWKRRLDPDSLSIHVESSKSTACMFFDPGALTRNCDGSGTANLNTNWSRGDRVDWWKNRRDQLERLLWGECSLSDTLGSKSGQSQTKEVPNSPTDNIFLKHIYICICTAMPYIDFKYCIKTLRAYVQTTCQVVCKCVPAQVRYKKTFFNLW